jgi:phage-related protein
MYGENTEKIVLPIEMELVEEDSAESQTDEIKSVSNVEKDDDWKKSYDPNISEASIKESEF